jgi:LmbE family N-acetylglucosaminyl deacetylase
MIRVIAFGAHPDDCEFGCGGTTALWTARGHAVKFVALTNGDIGHFRTAGGALAQRRAAEVRRSSAILGADCEVLDNHDGELEPTLENRRAVVRLIRRWKADVVLCHRPNDYHPDHRAVGTLVQDAAYMVTVPFFCPDAPALERNPLFLYFADRFTKPAPFTPDVVVAIDEVIDKKMDALEAIESQFFEEGCEGSADRCPTDPAARAAKLKTLRERFLSNFAALGEQFREAAAAWYGPRKVRYLEAFEVCEYSSSWSAISKAARRSDSQELRALFPFHPATP